MSTAVPEPDKRPVQPIRNPLLANGPPTSPVPPVVIRVGFVAYLRTMWSLLWTAFRHPMSTTYIDVKTGKVLRPRKK